MALWDKITSRGNVEDRRGMAPVVGGVSLAGVALYVIFNLLAGAKPADVLGSVLQNIPIQTQNNYDKSQFEGRDSYEEFASTVLGSNNDMWKSVFSKLNKNYTEPKLVLFRVSTDSACGVASSEVGPFYCPNDQTIYLDETFFDELTHRFGAKGGDVAQAYVISHEVGHHAQNELGIMDNINTQSNSDSVKLELQADCFSGLWSNSIKDLGVLGPGEIGEAQDAAAAVGDDRIQKSINGTVNPETWTHGSSEERVKWFNSGYNSGNLEACDTFK